MKPPRAIRYLALVAILSLMPALDAAVWGFARAEGSVSVADSAAVADSVADADSAAVGGDAAIADSASAADGDVIAAGELRTIDLSLGPCALAFTPPSGGVYDICVFPVDGEADATAELWQGRRCLASGAGALAPVSERLSSGARYTVVLRGTGKVRLEVARHALSRCFDLPLELDAAGDRYSKAVARPGDAHWYAIDGAGEGPLLLAGVPAREGLRLEAMLFDASGAVLAEAVQTVGGAFLMDFTPREGVKYRLRVSAPGGGTGLYELRAARSSGGMPEAVVLSQTEIVLDGRASTAIDARILPEGAADVLFWESSDSGVAAVNQQGVVTGRRPGRAVVTAYAAGSVSARCQVRVEAAPVRGVRLAERRIELRVGDAVDLAWAIEPANATDPRVRFAIQPSGVAEVDPTGALRAVGVGETVLTVRTADGAFEDSAEVIVSEAPTRYRALLVGEQGYAATAAAVRLGSANSVAAVRSMLGTLDFDGVSYEIETRLDASRDGVLRAIADALGGAAERDVSLFYITCHGYYADGMTAFQMYDGSILTAAELRQALDRVAGRIVVLIDCCGSGGAIARASGPSDILRGIDVVFGGTLGSSMFDASRFSVLASAALEQDSYRVTFDPDAAESDMATVFARTLCEAGGWSLDRGVRAAMRADADYDGTVTLGELYAYVSRRVMWYLSLGGDKAHVQSVQASFAGDPFPVFRRAQ